MADNGTFGIILTEVVSNRLTVVADNVSNRLTVVADNGTVRKS